MFLKKFIDFLLGQKKICVHFRSTDPNTFYAKKNNRSAKSGNSSVSVFCLRNQQQTLDCCDIDAF